MFYATEKRRGEIKTLRIKNEYVLFFDNPNSCHHESNFLKLVFITFLWVYSLVLMRNHLYQ